MKIDVIIPQPRGGRRYLSPLKKEPSLLRFLCLPAHIQFLWILGTYIYIPFISLRKIPPDWSCLGTRAAKGCSSLCGIAFPLYRELCAFVTTFIFQRMLPLEIFHRCATLDLFSILSYLPAIRLSCVSYTFLPYLSCTLSAAGRRKFSF